MGIKRIYIPSAVFYLAPVSFTVAGTLIGFLREGYWGLVVGALLGATVTLPIREQACHEYSRPFRRKKLAE